MNHAFSRLSLSCWAAVIGPKKRRYEQPVECLFEVAVLFLMHHVFHTRQVRLAASKVASGSKKTVRLPYKKQQFIPLMPALPQVLYCASELLSPQQFLDEIQAAGKVMPA